jgi:enoyl-CoA hydratase/carnithine racemase
MLKKEVVEMSEPKVNVKRPPDQPGALYIEFENPPMNQFTMDMWRKLVSVLRDARRDDSVRAVILTGAGDRAFTAGLSMEMLDTLQNDDDRVTIYTQGLEVREAIYALRVPVIVAVKGLCVGGGLEIALCCDLIYATEGSKFMLPEMNIALAPGCGGAIHLTQRIPYNRAFEMMLFTDKMTAEEAKSLGLVNAIFPKEEFDAQLKAVVDKIISKPPLAVRALKEIVAHENLSLNETAALAMERKYALDLMNSQDFKEAVSAFREKRTPTFTGK